MHGRKSRAIWCTNRSRQYFQQDSIFESKEPAFSRSRTHDIPAFIDAFWLWLSLERQLNLRAVQSAKSFVSQVSRHS
ncbi:MAG: hypothetical protein OJF52_003793 [Nitrospira sp.]|nr:MAG: hypothetical protein OJF52_003793 [Nitrospira sp.]